MCETLVLFLRKVSLQCGQVYLPPLWTTKMWSSKSFFLASAFVQPGWVHLYFLSLVGWIPWLNLISPLLALTFPVTFPLLYPELTLTTLLLLIGWLVGKGWPDSLALTGVLATSLSLEKIIGLSAVVPISVPAVEEEASAGRLGRLGRAGLGAGTDNAGTAGVAGTSKSGSVGRLGWTWASIWPLKVNLTPNVGSAPRWVQSVELLRACCLISSFLQKESCGRLHFIQVITDIFDWIQDLGS